MASNEPPPDSEEQQYVLRSGVRAGLKREFAFAMRAQSELPSLFGRTRRSSQSAKKPKVSEIALSSRSQPLDPVSVASSPVELNVPSSMDSLDVEGMKSGDGIENKENSAEFGAEMESPVSVVCSAPSQNGESHACAANGREEAAGGAMAGTQNESPIIYTRRKSLKTVFVVKKSGKVKMEDVSKPMEEQSQLESPVCSETPVIRLAGSALMQTSEENGLEGTASDVSKDLKTVFVESKSDMAKMEDLSNQMEEQLHRESPVSSEKPAIRFARSALMQTSEENALEGTASDVVRADVAQQEKVLDGPQEAASDAVHADLAPQEQVMDGPEGAASDAVHADLAPQEQVMDGLEGAASDAVHAGVARQEQVPGDPEGSASDVLHADVTHQKQVPGRRFTRSLLKDQSDCSNSKPALGEASAGGVPSRKNNMEIKMSKKISVNKVPSTVKDLLGTGLLEGLAVEYKFPNGRLPVLRGIIKGAKILCSCTNCRGSKAISPLDFELHANSMKKHPSKYIYLENGNNLRDVMKVCTTVPLDMLESAIQGAVGTAQEASTCINCKEPLTCKSGKLSYLCDLCSELHQSESTPKQLIATSGRTVRSPGPASPPMKTSSAKKTSSGQLTLKDLGLHKLVFESKKVPEGTMVCYRVHVKGKKDKMATLLKGHIKGSGIYCDCCGKVISPSQFEAHAGRPATRKPYNNTYIHAETDQGSTYTSLHDLAVMLSKDPALAPRRSDDLCRICNDGGTLIVCDICPRVFHPECVGLKDIPEGQFFCRLCKPSKLVDGLDGQVEQIVQQCTRIAITPETSVGGCALCKVPGFCSDAFNDETMLLCDQCDKEYHIGCLREHNIADFKRLPEEDWFCTGDCKKIHEAISNVVLAGAMQLQQSDLDLIRRKRSDKGMDTGTDPDLRWRLLLSSNWNGEDCKLLLGKIVDIFHESFSPIQDVTMKEDLIPQMIKGEKWKTFDYHGMCCAILSEGSSVVSVALLRVMGRDAAELPLVATSGDAQGLGYFHSLFNCIEHLLSDLGVKHFMIPSADETEAFWTSKFGFSKVTTQQLTEFLNGTRMTVFQGTSVLHKPVPPRERE